MGRLIRARGGVCMCADTLFVGLSVFVANFVGLGWLSVFLSGTETFGAGVVPQ